MTPFRFPVLGALLGLLLATATMAGPAPAADAILSAPDTVDPGQQVTVTIDADRAEGTLELGGPDTGKGYNLIIGAYPVLGPQVSLSAPQAPGSYELRYLAPGGRVLARMELEVAAPPVSLSAPDPLGAGYDGRVLWRGPGSPGDMIQVYDPATGRVLSEAPAIGGTASVNTAYVPMPELRGDFQIRYWHAAAGIALRDIRVTIGDGIGWLRSPIEVVAGARFRVRWNGPADPGMEYRIVDPGTSAVVSAIPATPTAEGAEPAVFTAPRKPGHYRVQLVNTATGFAVADLPLDVDPK